MLRRGALAGSCTSCLTHPHLPDSLAAPQVDASYPGGWVGRAADGAWHVKLRASAMPLLLLLLLLLGLPVMHCGAAPCRSADCKDLEAPPNQGMSIFLLNIFLHLPATCCPADCKDLDASCEPWANSGECEKNVEYMIGALACVSLRASFHTKR